MGRPKQYIEEVVLEKAMMSFWKNGYENTTVRQLENDMKINQFSIYASFKDKETLYKKSLVAYKKKIDSLYLGPMKTRHADIDNIRKFLRQFSRHIKNKKVPNSCMIVHALHQMETYDAPLQQLILDFFERMKELFVSALLNSQQKGLIRKELDIGMAAEYLIGIAQSISTYSKIKSGNEIKRFIDFSLERIK